MHIVTVWNKIIRLCVQTVRPLSPRRASASSSSSARDGERKKASAERLPTQTKSRRASGRADTTAGDFGTEQTFTAGITVFHKQYVFICDCGSVSSLSLFMFAR